MNRKPYTVLVTRSPAQRLNTILSKRDRFLEAKAKARQLQGQDFFLELSSRSRTVLEDPIPVPNTHPMSDNQQRHTSNLYDSSCGQLMCLRFRNNCHKGCTDAVSLHCVSAYASSCQRPTCHRLCTPNECLTTVPSLSCHC